MNASHTPDAPSSNAGLLTPEQEEKLHEVAQSRSETNQRGRRALMLLHMHAGKTQREVAAERQRAFLAEVTERWDELKSYVTDNFRIITHEGLTFVDGS